MHIGTNAFATSATDVETILANIDTWEGSNYPVTTVFLARIIDDVLNYGTELDVTTFNNNVASMVGARSNDRVLMVDMQNGAGLNNGNGGAGRRHGGQFSSMVFLLSPSNSVKQPKESHIQRSQIWHTSF